MTYGSIREYTTAMLKRYLGARKKEKSKLLSEFCAVTGYHRKAAVRLLSHSPGGKDRRGRQSQYGLPVTHALRKLWEASDHLCSKRLAPFIPDLVDALERHGELTMEPGVRELLLRVSASTIDRLLRPYRRRSLRRPYSYSTSSYKLKGQIPLRTFSEWKDVQPGSVQADLVLHCGETTQGFYINYPDGGGCSHRVARMLPHLGKRPGEGTWWSPPGASAPSVSDARAAYRQRG